MRFLTSKFVSFLFLGLFIAALFTACNKENIDEITPEAPDYEPENVEVNTLVNAVSVSPSGGLGLGCVTIQYPFDLELESGNTVTVNSNDEFFAAIDENAPDPVVNFVFPLTVTDADGNVLQVMDIDELGLLFGSCIPDNGWDNNGTLPAFLLENTCLDIVYPVNLEDLEENTYVANNESELINFLATIDPLFFTLPLTVQLEDGSEVVINTSDEFFTTVSLECDGVAPPVVGEGIEIVGFGCYEIVFPFDVQLEDSTIVTVEDENQYANLVLNGVEMVVQYPFTLTPITGGGDDVEINSIDDLIVAFAECGVIIDYGPVEDCGNAPAHILLFFNQGGSCGFQVDYPLQVIVTDTGETYDINNIDDYFVVYNMYSNQINAFEVVFPVSVTLTDGSTLIFNNYDEVCDFITGC